MIRDHRPYAVKRFYLRFQSFYTRRFLRPHFYRLGRNPLFIKPWHVEVFGGPIEMGAFGTVIAAPDEKVRFAVWPTKRTTGGIRIGDYCLICPGVRIGAAEQIIIEDSCMIAGRAYITDCDWHGLYDRTSTGSSAPIHIGKNVWIGDSAIICKGVQLGENAVVGAGAVVARDVPPFSVVAGNPARVVKQLEPGMDFITRADLFSNHVRLFREFDHLDREQLSGNSLLHWLRVLLFPARGE